MFVFRFYCVFVLPGESLKTRRFEMKSFGRKLRVECLEGRQMLAGGGLPIDALLAQIAQLQAQLSVLSQPAQAPAAPTAPSFTFVNKPVKKLDAILPSSTNVLLADFTLRANNRAYGRLEELLVLPADGSEQLAGNVSRLVLKLDRNGKVKDGCEATVAIASPNWDDDVVDLRLNRAVWVRNTSAMHFQIYADFNGYLSGSAIGVEVAQACFRDLRKQPVSDERVTYIGVNPVLHTMDNARVQISQEQMLPFGSVQQGDKDVTLFKYSTWTNNAVVDTISFSPRRSPLSCATNYVLKYDTNWDGVFDGFVPGTVSGVFPNDKVTFNMSSIPSNGTFEVHADFTSSLPAGSVTVMQLAIYGPGISGHNAETGKPLQGVSVNGNKTPSQINLYTNIKGVTEYNIVTPPVELVVQEAAPDESWRQASAGEDIVVNAGILKSATIMTLASMAFMDVSNQLHDQPNYSYTLWVDTDGNGSADTKVGSGQMKDTYYYAEQLFFDDMDVDLLPGMAVAYEVHATAPDLLPSTGIQIQFAGACGIKAKHADNSLVALDKIFTQGVRQTYWWMSENGGLG